MSEEYGIPYDPNTQKRLQDTNDVNAYDFLPEIPRLYYKSHIFGGSHIREHRESNLFNMTEKRIYKKSITTPKLMERMFLEILSNSIDNIYKSRRMGVEPKRINITMNAETISITNFGVPIPVNLHKYFTKQGQFGTAGELIFGVIGAGSNTSESVMKQGGGQNGYGAKLVNVFSREFIVEIGDRTNGFQQKIIWRKNMLEKFSSEITPSNYTLRDNWITDTDIYGGVLQINVPIMVADQNDRYTGEDYVRISWKQDFRKFLVTSYSEDELQLYMRFAAEASFHSKIPIMFNDFEMKYQNVNDFLKIFSTQSSNKPIIHYEWENNVSPGISGTQLDHAVSAGHLVPVVELVIIDTPNTGQHISYCNGIYNVHGGVHTNEAYREVLNVIKEVIKSTKGFEKSGLDLDTINVSHLKKHITIVINFRCNEPVFKGQDKESLNKPTPKIKINVDDAARIKKWKAVDSIYTTLTGKQISSTSKGQVSLRIKGDFNFQEANWIGTNRTQETCLVLVEGLSAGSSALQFILATPERRDKYAILPIQGKITNITDMSILEVEQIREVMKIIRYSGLKYGIDYTTPEGKRMLKYGNLEIMTDADSDGSHISCLNLNILFRLFPSVLIAGLVKYYPTPVIRIMEKKARKDVQKYVFYNMSDYKNWAIQNPNSKLKIKYIKGLASSSKELTVLDAQQCPIVYINFDQLAAQSLDIAFRKGLTNKRKEWIQFNRDKIENPIIRSIDQNNPRVYVTEVSSFINTKLVEYCIDTFSRALPSYKDGLKKSQRQLIYYLCENWNYGKSNKDEVKLAELAGSASTLSKYHHGDLADTLARMGSDYPGANNVIFLSKDGAFGTRSKLGRDVGASRYVHTRPNEIFKMLFDQELTKLVDQNIVQNEKVEPKYYPITLPIAHIINGHRGIATGFSTSSPCYHPIDIIDWITCYINQSNPFPLIPWFKGFKGEVYLEITKSRQQRDSTYMMDGQQDLPYFEGLTCVTKGIFKVLNERMIREKVDNGAGKMVDMDIKVYDIHVTEIPIDVATAKFISEIDKYSEKIDDKISDPDYVDMIIIGYKKEPTEKNLGMVSKIGMTNITLIDDDAFPIQLKNIYESLVLYCDNMVNLYIQLKTTRLREIQESIIKVSKTIKLLELILSGTLRYQNVEEEEIESQLKLHEIEYEIYEKLGFRNITKKGLAKLYKELNDLNSNYTIINERHHLTDWNDKLQKLRQHFIDEKEYQKYQHHIYPYVYTPIEKLLDGTIKSPFNIKEEAVPLSL